MTRKVRLAPLLDMDFDNPLGMEMDVDSSLQELALNFRFPDQASPKQTEQRDLSQIEVFNEGFGVKYGKLNNNEMSGLDGTGGGVAEAEPAPDFSLWTMEDDILLKNSMEAGVAIVALAKGAVQFSQRYTAKEIRERWRVLLYDPLISEEAAIRMLKSEALVINMGKLSNMNKLKYPLVSNRKRKLKSVRFHYYNKKKCNAFETHVKEEPESCSESSFSQMVRLFPGNEVPELAEAMPSEDAFQGNKTSAHRLPNEEAEQLPSSILPEEQGGKQIPQELSISEKKLSVSINESKQQLLATKQVPLSYNVSENDGSQMIPPHVMLDKRNPETMESCNDDIVSEKSLTIKILVPEQMLCVLNTEDTEIPTPPLGSAASSPCFFSSRYFPMELKSVKSEPGLPGGGYPRSDDYELSAHELRHSLSESKKNMEPLVKQESMLESLEFDLKYRTKMQASYPSAHMDSIDISAPNNGKEAPDSLENAGGHSLKGMLLSQEKANDLSLLHGPGYLKGLVSPKHKEMLNHLDEDLCHTDQTADIDAVKRSTITEQEHDDGLESDQDLPSFSDVEAMILDMDLDSAFDEDAQARAESRRLYQRQRKTLVRLEQGARASFDRTLTRHGAIAVLYGHRLRYYIKRNEVLLGRVTLDNAVDIDLAKEGRANKVSRRQADHQAEGGRGFLPQKSGQTGSFRQQHPNS